MDPQHHPDRILIYYYKYTVMMNFLDSNKEYKLPAIKRCSKNGMYGEKIPSEL